MTLPTIILLNAILDAVVTYGLVWLLVRGIASDRDARVAHVRGLRRRQHAQLAAH